MTAAQRALLPRYDLVPAERVLGLRGDVTKHVDGAPDAWAWADPRRPAPAVLAVDVGADAAVALISDASVTVIGFRFPALDGESLGNAMRAIQAARAAHQGPLLAMVEDTFAGVSGRANVETKAGLDRRVGALVAILGVAHPVVRVRAAVWQPRVIGKQTRDAGKRASLDAMRARFPKLAIGDDNEADALGLALFGRKGRMPCPR